MGYAFDWLGRQQRSEGKSVHPGGMNPGGMNRAIDGDVGGGEGFHPRATGGIVFLMERGASVGQARAAWSA